jgi:endoglycosylceramidase
VVVVHGTNMVYKLPPYDPAAAGFGADDARFLDRIGFNAVRVGVIWKAVEPQPGVYDDAYLNEIVRTVRTLARRGIYSLLDFHQDMYNERFQGEGAPDWAVQDAGLPNPKFGFPGNYVGNPALQHALDQFFDDAPGPGGISLGQRFAAAWAHVAARFRHAKGVLGYELFNEPFPGTLWPACASGSTCPFDSKLSALYRRVDAAIRAVDARTLVFFEPNVLFNNGAGTAVVPPPDRRDGFAFHDYCQTEPQTGSPAGCDQFDDLVFSNALSYAARYRTALLETEFGSTTDVAYLRDSLARADRDMVPWLEWAYCGCHSPTDTGSAGIVADPTKPPRGSNLVRGTLGALVEPYPQLISGTPLSWGFTVDARTFKFRYSTRHARGRGWFRRGSTTIISTPRLVYHGHYAARVKGGALVSRPGASLLRIASCRRSTTVTVTVKPSGRSHASCRIRGRQPRKR